MKPLFGFFIQCMYRGRLINSSPVKISWTKARDLRKRQPWALARAHPFGLEKRVGHRADDHVMLPARIRPALEVIEPEFGFEVLVVLFDRPALMRQADELRQRGGRGQRDEVVLRRPVGPRPRSQSSQISGASRRCRQSVAGVTRRAAKSASHGGLVPLRHATRRHARGGNASLSARTLTGSWSGQPPRRLRGGGCVGSTRSVGVPRKTVSVGEMPSA